MPVNITIRISNPSPNEMTVRPGRAVIYRRRRWRVESTRLSWAVDRDITIDLVLRRAPSRRFGYVVAVLVAALLAIASAAWR